MFLLWSLSRSIKYHCSTNKNNCSSHDFVSIGSFFINNRTPNDSHYNKNTAVGCIYSSKIRWLKCWNYSVNKENNLQLVQTLLFFFLLTIAIQDIHHQFHISLPERRKKRIQDLSVFYQHLLAE